MAEDARQAARVKETFRNRYFESENADRAEDDYRSCYEVCLPNRFNHFESLHRLGDDSAIGSEW